MPFPLDFAPSLAHRGLEEIRFAPGFFDPAAPGYWSYVFAWRLDDAAVLDAGALGEELGAYFYGLILAVDDKHRISKPAVMMRAIANDPGSFTLDAHLVDPFTTGQPITLAGTATRTSCGSGALWVFTLAPPTTTLRAELDEVAASAACSQAAPKK